MRASAGVSHCDKAMMRWFGRHRKRLGALLCGVLSVLWPLVSVAVSAQSALKIDADTHDEELNPYLEYFVDPSGFLNIQDVVSGNCEFSPSGHRRPNFGFQSGAVWLRFRLENLTNEALERFVVVDNPTIEQIRFYYAQPNGGFQVAVGGSSIPYSQRPYKYRQHVFSVEIPPSETVSCYVRIATDLAIILDLRLRSLESLEEHDRDAEMVLAAYAGLLFAVILYNLIVFLTIKEVEYLHLALLTVFAGGFILSCFGITALLLWPENTWWAVHALPTFGSLGLYSGMAFTRRFLNAKQLTPILDRLMFLLGLSGLAICAVTYADLPLAHKLVNIGCTLAFLLMLITSVRTYASNYQPARYLILGQFVTGIGGLLFTFMVFGYLEFNMWTTTVGPFSFGVGAIVLTMAITDRLNTLQKVRREELEQQVSRRTEDLSKVVAALQSEITARERTEASLQKAHDELEVRVQERTKELREVNEKLQATITELEQAEDARERLHERLVRSQRMEAVGRIAGGIAHDFNNILTTIIGNASLALDEMQADDKWRTTFEDIIEAANRAAHLTRQLLAYGRKQIITPRALDLNEVVHGQLQMLAPILGRDIAVELSLKDGLAPIRADSTQVEQIVFNLTTNAVEAMPSGGTLKIETDERHLETLLQCGHEELPPGDYVTLAVTDSGRGIGPEALPMIFEPFYTTKEVGEGSGLGLSMVYGSVRQHGGAVDVTSQKGKGATFRVFFPVFDPRRQPNRESARRTPLE